MLARLRLYHKGEKIALQTLNQTNEDVVARSRDRDLPAITVGMRFERCPKTALPSPSDNSNLVLR